MTNRPIALPAYPTTDPRAYALLLSALRDALAESAAITDHDYDPMHEYRDHDDYLNAALDIANAIHTAIAFDPDMTPLAILDSLLADDDFRDACDCADFSTDLFRITPYDYDR